VDDFGTGYSSLAYLKRFPIDTLKIDKSFIDGLPGNEDDESITTTIIRLGMGLALHIVAEGVETPAQRGFLAVKGCHEGQGYLFGKPMPVDEFEAQPGFTSGISGRL
jgi:EAL domain-containing protein (putative c-di-GMP-specific phosphodiesterase class I)